MTYNFPEEYHKNNGGITDEYYKYDGKEVNSHITDMLDKFIKDIEDGIDNDKEEN